ncbi:polysaccharide lyase 8 family protein [Streptomyces sp. DH24]|uniref:polysaccharide lyase 8 family protein n=1 Tax=Streptomyces sp. DH24 TaxID=3040123 RepID=UPI002443384E|nr:polysaccharide lyase 8 family protein [Streptomyces sp. DH24]MDG9715419.1 polysaccharide lyase 8 family protein [Streptomyces sp. DH24]
MPSLSRRTLLYAVLAAGAAAPLNLTATGRAHAADAYDTLRLKWRDLLLGTGYDPAAEPYASRLALLGETAAQLRATLRPAAGSLWPELVYADPEPDTDPESFTHSENLGTSYNRLRILTEAYAQPGTGLTGDPALRTEILTALDHLHDEAYHPGQTRYGNWWNWQIGIPQALLDICAHLYDHLGATRVADFTAAVDHFVPDSVVADYTGISTGANRVDLCRVLALRGVIGKDPAKLALARDALAPVFPYVTSGDGLYTDGSFIQHTYVPYTGTYGAVLLGGLSLLLTLLDGSAWDVTDPNRQIVFDSVEKAYAPFLYNGLVMDSVSGRAVSRGVQQKDTRRILQDDHLRGHILIACIALLGNCASGAEKARWDGMIKGWIARDRHRPVLASDALGVAQLARLKAVADSTATPATPEPVGHRLFPAADRAVHRRPRWAANVSMASDRITHYENGNGEHLRGWHTGSGMLYWWGDTYGNDQYSDAFWATVDPMRLPGTTVSRKPLADAEGGSWGAPRPDVRWVGGTTDGTYAAVGQHLKGLSSTLVAKKSWFFLDDAIVCLGAGIHGRDGTGVETIVDNRNLGADGTHTLTVDGGRGPAALGSAHLYRGAGWAHLAGFGGYVFPGGAGLRTLREARSGAWSDINTGGTTDPVTRRYLTLWFDHGTDPTGERYAYLLLPGATAAQTAARARDRGRVRLLANTDAQQGVRDTALGFTGVNFWLAGTVGDLTATAPAAVLVRETGGTATLCVSGPLRDGVAIDVTWHRPVVSVTSHDPTVQVLSTGKQVTLRVTPGTAGAVHRAVVRPG